VWKIVVCVYESGPRKVNSVFGLITVTNGLQKPYEILNKTTKNQPTKKSSLYDFNDKYGEVGFMSNKLTEH
jgi:hypothetical protein